MLKRIRNILKRASSEQTPRLTVESSALVFDNGSRNFKAGHAGYDNPCAVFATALGKPQFPRTMQNVAGLGRVPDTFVGEKAQKMRGILALRYPIENGIINNWDDMETIWNHAYEQLPAHSGEWPLLMTEVNHNPAEKHQKMVEIMFEKFKVPAF